MKWNLAVDTCFFWRSSGKGFMMHLLFISNQSEGQGFAAGGHLGHDAGQQRRPRRLEHGRPGHHCLPGPRLPGQHPASQRPGNHVVGKQRLLDGHPQSDSSNLDRGGEEGGTWVHRLPQEGGCSGRGRGTKGVFGVPEGAYQGEDGV